jgi:hypothetical protein
LQGPYKLLWLYIQDECDHAGIWPVDIEVAAIRIGAPEIEISAALRFFKGKIFILEGGNKWFIPGFIEEQYGELNPQNRVHDSVIKLLRKFGIDEISLTPKTEIKDHASPLQGAKDKDMDKDKDKAKAKYNAHAHTPARSINGEEDEWKPWVEAWFVFYQKRVGVKPAFNSVQAAALKRIKSHLTEINGPATGDNTDHVNLWQHILSRWDDLDPWMRTQFDLKVISQKINIIIENLKNGTGKKSTAAAVSTASAFAKIDKLTGAN